MSLLRTLSHTPWHCHYHIVWVPKYRYRILTGHGGHEGGSCIRACSEQKDVDILDMNIGPDHIHLVTMIPPTISLSDYCGIVKGRTALRLFNTYKGLSGTITVGLKDTVWAWIQK